MKVFKKMDPQLLQRYADILNIPADELMDVNRIREIKLEHEG